MLTFRGKVRYNDGREVEFETGTAALGAYEDYAVRHNYPYGKEMPPTLMALVMAHYALGIEEGFDKWRPTVFGVELDSDAVDPTGEEASDA